VISFDAVVGELLGDVGRGGDQVIQDPQVRAGLVGGDLDWRPPVAESAGEEPAGGGGVPLLGQQYVDDLPVLVDGPVEVPPPAGDLDVGLVHEPPVAAGVPQWAGGVSEQRGEPLHPPVHRDVVGLDTALGQQLLDIPVGQPVTQVPADRDRNHLRWEPEPGERRPLDVWTGGSRSTHPPSFLSQRHRHRPGSKDATEPTGLGSCHTTPTRPRH
jgi:hypothetical protein